MAPSILVSTLPLKVSGAGANDLGLSAINAVGDGLRYDPPRSAANPTPAHKPNEGVAAAALPRMSALPMVVAEEPKIPLAAVAAAAPMLIEQGTPSAPSSGKTWVEEAKWSIIPCAAARIDLGPGAKCQTGPPAMRGGHCDIARQAAMITNTRYQIEAEVAIFDPYKVTAVGPQGKECAVWAGQPNTPDYFKNLNQVTQRGGGWTNLIKGGSQNTASFTEHGRNCLAVQRLGPPWHGGYVWVVYASICSAAGSIQPTEIDDALVTLRLRTYDAQANLRVQSD